jgi:divalent metal cation (Fe/Co/Zn/Cd) transporter
MQLNDTSAELDNKGDTNTLANSHATNQEAICIHLSFWSNVALTLALIVASILTLSLSLISSTIIFVLAVLSGIILFIANRMQQNVTHETKYMYPIGQARLEPIAFVIFASAMVTSSAFVIFQSCIQIVQGLVKGPQDAQLGSITKDPYLITIFHWIGVSVLCFTVISKTILYFYCRRFMSSPAIQAFTIDHRNDVIANVVAVVAVLVSSYVWWIDPLGAILLSVFFIYNWSSEAWGKSQ